MKSLTILYLFLALSIVIGIFWDQVPIIKESANFILNPTAGRLLDYEINLGMIIITALISLFTIIVQKYTVDNASLRELKNDHKKMQQDMKSLKDNPEKLMELQGESMKKSMEVLSLSSKSFIYTTIPLVLFIRWFGDYFSLVDVKIFGFMHWLFAYILFSLIFSIIFRRLFKLP